jgi:C-22 sterol desaturase
MENATSSPLANAQYPVDTSALAGVVSRLTQGLSGWTVALTLFLGLVVYDQCM